MPVKSRRRAREAALRALYQIDLVDVDMDQALESVELYSELPADQRSYAKELVAQVLRNREFLDQTIASKLRDWTFDRLAPIDRSILRIATQELHFQRDVPPAVTLNEAIELAKKYSTADSGKFVNGILAAILVESPKADWRPEEVEDGVEEVAEPEAELVEVEELVEGSAEEAELARTLPWTVRSESDQR